MPIRDVACAAFALSMAACAGDPVPPSRSPRDPANPAAPEGAWSSSVTDVSATSAAHERDSGAEMHHHHQDERR